MRGSVVHVGDGPVSTVLQQWKERCWGVNTLSDLRHDGPSHLRLQIKGIVGKGGLGEDTYLLIADTEYWVKADVSQSIKNDIKEGELDVDDIIEIRKTHGVLHNLLIVRSFSLLDVCLILTP